MMKGENLLEKNYYTSMCFPMKIDPASGRFVQSRGNQSIKESVYLILMTQKTERFARPDFGTTVYGAVFQEPNGTRIHMFERELKEELMRQEPRICSLDVVIHADESGSRMIADVNYTTKEGMEDHAEILL